VSLASIKNNNKLDSFPPSEINIDGKAAKQSRFLITLLVMSAWIIYNGVVLLATLWCLHSAGDIRSGHPSFLLRLENYVRMLDLLISGY